MAGVDYKLLMAVDKDPLMLLLPALSSSNIHTVASIAQDIPCGPGATLTQGMVLCAYALKLFWTSDKSSSSRLPVSTQPFASKLGHGPECP